MTYQERIKKIVDSIDDVIEIAKAESVNAIYGEVNTRIFNDGKDKTNQQIGTYSNTKLPASFFNGKALNKSAKFTAKQYPNGLSYKDFRALNGLQTQFVDLTFSTNLRGSITRSKDTIYFKNQYGKKISGYNEKSFGKRIFAPSKDERMIYLNTLEKELNKLWT